MLSAVAVEPCAVGCPASAASKPVVMFVGAHPDDSEGFMGLALLMREKYTVQFVDFTRGEGGCGEEGFLDGTTAARRIAEERDVCRAFGTSPRFLSQMNYRGRAHADAQATAELVDLLVEFKPVAVFTHWPVDDHEDHVQCAATVLHALSNAARAGHPRPELYFFEVAVWQTMNYRPTYYVDVTSVIGEVSAQIRKYASQDGVKLDANKRARMQMRGAQVVPHVEYAETFTTFDGKPMAGGVLESLEETIRAR